MGTPFFWAMFCFARFVFLTTHSSQYLSTNEGTHVPSIRRTEKTMGLAGPPLIQTSQKLTVFGIIRIRSYWEAIPSRGNSPLTREEDTLWGLEGTSVPQPGESVPCLNKRPISGQLGIWAQLRHSNSHYNDSILSRVHTRTSILHF